MRRSLRAAVMLFAAALMIPVSAVTATAAVINDTPDTATPVVMGETIIQDTREASTESLDATLNGDCDAPAVRGSVWFTYTSDKSEGPGFLVDGSDSRPFDDPEGFYDLGLMVFEGDPTAGGVLMYCGPQQAATYTTEGMTYYVMAFTANASDPVGGSLVLHISAAPPTPQMAVTVDPRGVAYKDGSARLTGTYTCTDADYSEVYGNLTQRVGRLKIIGDFYLTDLTCDGGTYPWEAYASSSTGYFSGGKAAQLTMAFACGALECVDGYAESTIQLSRARK